APIRRLGLPGTQPRLRRAAGGDHYLTWLLPWSKRNWEHLPVLVVVPVETRYLKGLGEDLSCLFYLASMVDDGCDLDPGRTVYLTMHGSVDVSEDDQIMAGSPSLPSMDPDRWISLDPPSVATLVRWVRGPEDQRPSAVVNTGCFSSSRRRYKSTTFN